MRLALKFAYDGTKFHGYQRQRGLPTVEGEILRALGKLAICRDPRASGFSSASRTDRGVSALGNVVALDTTFRPRGIARALNSQLNDIWFWGVATVEADFRPRHARERWYRYHLPEGYDRSALQEAATLFVGCHELKGFTRAHERTSREIRAIEVGRWEDLVIVDLRAQSFSWNLVRRVVAPLMDYAQGRTSLSAIRRSLEDGRARFGLAPPEPLVLMDVDYGITFRVEIGRPTLRLWNHSHHLHRVHTALFDDLRKMSDQATP